MMASTNPALTTEMHKKGGHVGFVSAGPIMSSLFYGEFRVMEFLDNFARRKKG
jgi:predicted alpha/beta-fold hydrolase